MPRASGREENHTPHSPSVMRGMGCRIRARDAPACPGMPWSAEHVRETCIPTTDCSARTQQPDSYMLNVARRSRGLAPVLLSFLVSAACAGDDVRGGADTSVDVATETQLPTGMPQEGANAPIDTVRTPAGTWTLGLAENKLRGAQLSISREGTEVRRPGLGVPGTRYDVGGATLELFLYADAIARGRDTDALDTSRLTSAASEQPVLMSDGNLAALLFSRDASIASRVRSALRMDPDDGPLEPAGVTPPPGARRSVAP